MMSKTVEPELVLDSALREPAVAPLGAARVGIGITMLDVVIPVYNEQADLARAVLRLRTYLETTFPDSFRITIADNASTDATGQIADELAGSIVEVTVLHLAEKGRGWALKAAWAASDAKVLAYMDVDLSTDLAALLPLIEPLVTGHSDVAIGSRLAPGSRVIRRPQREFISRSYNQFLRYTLSSHFSDAQCGFKAIRADVAKQLLPMVVDNGWFFDTELLLLAERAGLRIYEVPVDWVDDPNSSVDIIATAMTDIKGVWRVGRALASGSLPLGQVRVQLGRGSIGPEPAGVPTGMTRQVVRFAAVGVVSTAVYLLLFSVFRPVMGAQAANFLALGSTAIANTAANRRFTFGIREKAGAAEHQLRGLGIFLLGLAITGGSLVVLHAAAPAAGRLLELAVLLLANLVATLLRFVLMRGWVFRRDPAAITR